MHILSHDLSSDTPIADFSYVGQYPSISDGQDPWVAFAAHSDELGDGIYVAKTSDPSAWYKIVGEADDGHLDPNENWHDTDHNEVYGEGEDDSPIQSINLDGRIGISRNEQGDLTVTFFADILGPDGQTHYSMNAVQVAPPGAANEPSSPKTAVDPSRTDEHYLPRRDYWGADPVVIVGDTLPGAGTVQAIDTFDPINDQGQVVFWATTDQGQFIIRANPIGAKFVAESRIEEPEPEDQTVDPVPVIYSTVAGVTASGLASNKTYDGVVDQFYVDDNGKLTLRINNASDPAPHAHSGTLHVAIDIDGSPDRFLEVTGLAGGSFTVSPGMLHTVTFAEMSLKGMLKDYTRDTLFGVQVSITFTNDAGEQLGDKETFDIFRFLAVVDPGGAIDNTPNFIAPFLKTQSGVESTKMLDYYLPTGVETRFVDMEDSNGKGLIDFGGPLQGSSDVNGPATWTFDTPEVQVYTDYVESVRVTVGDDPLTNPLDTDREQIRTLLARQTVAPKITIGLNLADLRGAIDAYFLAYYTFANVPTLRPRPSPQLTSLLETAQGDQQILGALRELIVERVRAIVQDAYAGIPGVEISDGTGTVQVKWDEKRFDYHGLFPKGVTTGNPTLGDTYPVSGGIIETGGFKQLPIPFIDLNLEQVLFNTYTTNQVSLAAKAYAFGEAMREGGNVRIYLDNCLSVDTRGDFGSVLGLTFSHEFGHALGLNESAGPNQYAYPADLMSGYPMPGSFAAAHVAALRFTAGRQGDPDPDLLLALGVYETNWDFSTGPPRTPVDGPGSASPNAVQSAAPNGPSASPVTPDQPAATATPNEPSTATVAPPLTSTVDVMPGQAATLESGPVAATLAATPSKTYDQLTVEYVVNQNPYNYPITLRVYRSQQKEYDRDNPEQVMIVDVQLLPKDSENGKHTITVSMDGDYQFIDDGSGLPALRPDPTHEFVITTLDDDGALNPHDVYNTPQTEFRIWLVAAVAHGFTARGVDAASTILNQGSLLVTNSNFFSTDTVPWVDPMVSALMDNNYDYALPVHWEKLSNKNEPISGGELAALRGYQLALEIAGMLPDKDVTSHLDGFDPEKDIVDVHFIGHSRGTVIISQALMDLNGSNTVFENYNLDNVPRWLKNGFQLMTLLDPHPANNEYSKLDRNKSLDKNALSSLVAFGTTKFQSAGEDDIVVVPSNVWAAEDYYQKTAAKDAPGNENIVNLWGLSVDELEDESYVTIQEHNVTGNGIGHGEVVDDIYRAIVDQGTDENDFPYTLLALGLTPFGARLGTDGTLAGDRRRRRAHQRRRPGDRRRDLE